MVTCKIKKWRIFYTKKIKKKSGMTDLRNLTNDTILQTVKINNRLQKLRPFLTSFDIMVFISGNYFVTNEQLNYLLTKI